MCPCVTFLWTSVVTVWHILPMSRRAPIADRFWAKVEKTEGCWEWTGSKSRKGYGQFNEGRAHRVSWEMHNGPIPEGMFVCHHCDNPPCVRPDHLFIGDNAANMRDAFAKGRHTTPLMRSGRAIKQPPKAECIHGHPLTLSNTYLSPARVQYCRACSRAHSLAYYHRTKQLKTTTEGQSQ